MTPSSRRRSLWSRRTASFNTGERRWLKPASALTYTRLSLPRVRRRLRVLFFDDDKFCNLTRIKLIGRYRKNSARAYPTRQRCGPGHITGEERILPNDWTASLATSRLSAIRRAPVIVHRRHATWNQQQQTSCSNRATPTSLRTARDLLTTNSQDASRWCTWKRRADMPRYCYCCCCCCCWHIAADSAVFTIVADIAIPPVFLNADIWYVVLTALLSEVVRNCQLLRHRTGNACAYNSNKIIQGHVISTRVIYTRVICKVCKVISQFSIWPWMALSVH